LLRGLDLRIKARRCFRRGYFILRMRGSPEVLFQESERAFIRQYPRVLRIGAGVWFHG
jgi:hypothetical protein